MREPERTNLLNVLKETLDEDIYQMIEQSFEFFALRDILKLQELRLLQKMEHYYVYDRQHRTIS